MNKVITINLNGRAYQLEEAGYKILQDYLDKAAEKLGENPDKDEIMADFEQAIAEKCDALLAPHKTVVTDKEVAQIIEEMGPVDSEASGSSHKEDKDGKSSEKNGASDAPKRLYLIREGAVFSGVCTGLAAYLNIDVTIVRVIFVILTILTHGAWILVYFIMAVVVPYANTSEQKAEAYGLPFNANELIQRAREKYAHFDNEYWKEYKKQWKEQAHEHVERTKEYHQKAHQHAKQRAREMHRNAHQNGRKRAREFRHQWENEWYKNVPAYGQYHTGVGTVILVIIMILITLAWLAAIFSLLTTGMILGIAFTTMPVWMTILLLTCAYNILLFPIRRIKAAGTSYNPYGYYQADAGWFGLLDAIMWFTIMGLMGWALWTYVPQSHEVLYKVSNWAEETFHLNSTQENISLDGVKTQQQTMENI